MSQKWFIAFRGVMDYFSFSFSVFKVLFSVAKGWTETKKYGKISIKNDALKSGVDGEYLL